MCVCGGGGGGDVCGHVTGYMYTCMSLHAGCMVDCNLHFHNRGYRALCLACVGVYLTHTVYIYTGCMLSVNILSVAGQILYIHVHGNMCIAH